MAKEIPSTVFNDWKEYWNLEPFGAWRDNLHSATLTALLANQNLPKGKSPYSERDFMYEDSQTRQERLERESIARTKNLFQTLKAKAKKND